jgi:hypothetical protein
VPYTIGNYTEQGRWAAGQLADVFLAIHHDAGGGTGCSAIIHNDSCTEGRKLGQALCAGLAAEFGLQVRGVGPWSRGRLGVLAGGDNWRKSRAACLIECAFVDGDNALLTRDDYVPRAAMALARGVHAYLGLPVPLEWSGNQPALDSATPSDWAVNAWEWATERGLLTGDPRGNVTREALAAVLQRYSLL